MTVRTLVSYVATAVCRVVRSLLHHFLPLDESRVESVNPEEGVRKAAAELTKNAYDMTELCVIGNMFKVAGDTCNSAPVLKAAAAAFNAKVALKEIGVHLPIRTVPNMYIKGEEFYENVGFQISCMTFAFQQSEKAARSELAKSATGAKEAQARGQSEPADVLGTALTFFKAAVMVDELYVNATPLNSTVADVFNVAKDSGDSAAVFKVATAVFYGALRKFDVDALRDVSAEELQKLKDAASSAK